MDYTNECLILSIALSRTDGRKYFGQVLQHFIRFGRITLADVEGAKAAAQNVYEAYKRKTGMTLIALQPNVPDDAYMSHMKGMYVPFNMAYGSLIYH